MLAHSSKVEAALEETDAIFVSAEDVGISPVSREFGALVEAEVERFERFLSLPPLAPLRSVGDVQRCLAALTDSTDLVLTISASWRNPWHSFLVVDAEGCVRLVNVVDGVSLRQDAPAARAGGIPVMADVDPSACRGG